MKQRTNSSIVKSAKPIFTQRYTALHSVTQRYTALHSITQHYNLCRKLGTEFSVLILCFFMMLPNWGFGQKNPLPQHNHSNCGTIIPDYEHDRLLDYSASRTGTCQVKHVNINFHFMSNANMPNFTANDDGQGNTNYTGYHRAKDLVDKMNYYFQNNIKMVLPGGGGLNNTPVNDIDIQFVLTGVYFQEISPTYVNEGVNKWTINRDLGVNQVEEINVFMINDFDPNDPDQADGVASCNGGQFCNVAYYFPTEPNPGTFGKAVKIFSDYYNYLSSGTSSKDFIAKVLNHEVGHNLSLFHAWGYGRNQSDHCDDTPYNNNCWAYGANPQTLSGIPTVFKPCLGTDCCNEISEISNNFMDYNNIQQAVTPCQINRMHNDLDALYGITYVNSCNSCSPSNAFFYLPQSVCLTSTVPINLDGRGSWKNTGYAIVIYEVAYTGANTSIGGYYSTFSYGTLGVINLRNLYTFQIGKTYRVELITTNSCANSSAVKYIQIKSPTCTLTPPGSVDRVTNPNEAVASQNELVNLNDAETDFMTKTTLSVAPNPAINLIELAYFPKENGQYRLSILNLYGQEIEQISIIEHFDKNLQTLQHDISNLTSGTYVLLLQTPTERITQKLIIVK